MQWCAIQEVTLHIRVWCHPLHLSPPLLVAVHLAQLCHKPHLGSNKPSCINQQSSAGTRSYSKAVQNSPSRVCCKTHQSMALRCWKNRRQHENNTEASSIQFEPLNSTSKIWEIHFTETEKCVLKSHGNTWLHRSLRPTTPAWASLGTGASEGPIIFPRTLLNLITNVTT